MLNAEIKTFEPVYDNTALKKLLGVSNDLLRTYRNEGLIGYSSVGSKYWYTADDVISFLQSTHLDAFEVDIPT